MKIWIWVLVLAVIAVLGYMLWKKSRPVADKIASLKCGQPGAPRCTEADLKAGGMTPAEIQKAKEVSLIAQNAALAAAGF